MTGLNVSDVVNVGFLLSPKAAPSRNFGSFLILGTSNVIDTRERVRAYTDLTTIGVDFGGSSPEYQAATVFFGQTPQPSMVYIGRYANTATAGLLHGSLLAPQSQLISNFTSINNGALLVYVDGAPQAVTGVNLSQATTLNGVAAALQTAISAKATGATVTWDPELDRFTIGSGTTGPTSNVTGVQAPTAVGTFTFSGQPSPNDTITLNGTAVTFVASGATGNQVNIGTDLPTTLANLLTFLNSSTDTQIAKFDFAVAGSVLYVVAAAPGTAGNALTLAKSGTAATVSGSTLAGGTGTDLSGPMGLTANAGAISVAGVAPESPLDAVNAAINASADWFGVSFAVPLSDAQHIAVARLIQGQAKARMYGVTIQNPNVLDGTVSSDLGSQLALLGYNNTYWQYSSTSPYAAVAFFARAATVDFEGLNTTITLKFKREPGVVPETLTESQAAAIDAKNGNVFVVYNNGTAIIQQGVVSSGAYFDEIHGLSWLTNAVQNDLFNLLITQPKVAQTDDGVHLLVAEAKASCARGVRNGLLAEGQWNGPNIATLKTGDILTGGFGVYTIPVALQSVADRAARKSPPISIAVKLAGAIHSVNALITVDR